MREELIMYIVIASGDIDDVEARVNEFLRDIQEEQSKEIWRNIEGLRYNDGLWYQVLGRFEKADAAIEVVVVG